MVSVLPSAYSISVECWQPTLREVSSVSWLLWEGVLTDVSPSRINTRTLIYVCNNVSKWCVCEHAFACVIICAHRYTQPLKFCPWKSNGFSVCCMSIVDLCSTLILPKSSSRCWHTKKRQVLETVPTEYCQGSSRWSPDISGVPTTHLTPVKPLAKTTRHSISTCIVRMCLLWFFFVFDFWGGCMLYSLYCSILVLVQHKKFVYWIDHLCIDVSVYVYWYILHTVSSVQPNFVW